MIIKIKGLDKDDWWLFDNIVKIRHGGQQGRRVLFDTESNECTIRNDNGQYIAFTPDVLLIDYTMNSTKPFALNWASCRLLNGNELFIAFYTDAYILNDSGKTVEIIP